MIRRVKRNLSFLGVLSTDLVMIAVAIALSHYVRLGLDHFEWMERYNGKISDYYFFGLQFVVVITLMYLFGLYTRRNDFWMETKQIVKAVIAFFVLAVVFAFLTKTSVEYSRLMFILITFNMLWLLPAGRLVSKWVLVKSGVWLINAWIVGEGRQAERLKKNLCLNRYLGYLPVERNTAADIVFIATEGMPVAQLERTVHLYKMNKKEVVLIPYLHNISFANAEIIDLSIGRMSMINIQNQLFRPRNIMMKKIAELMLVLLLSPLIALVFSVIAVWIKLDSPGSIFFRQKRMGKDDETFMCFKFRSMYENGDELLAAYLEENPGEKEYYEKYHKYHNDPRITRAARLYANFHWTNSPRSSMS